MITERLSNNLNGPRVMSIVDSVVPVELVNCILPEKKVLEDDALTQQAFVLHNCRVILTNVIFDEPTCTSNFCDCVQAYSSGKKEYVCPCYARTCNEHPIIAVIDFDVYPGPGDDGKFSVQWFTSKRLTNWLFTETKVKSGVRASLLNEFRAKIKCRRAFNAIFNYVNDGGDLKNSAVSDQDKVPRSGWTVIGWTRRGTHDDQGIDGYATEKGGNITQSSTLTHHVTSMKPTYDKYLSQIESLRFESASLIPGSSNHRTLNSSDRTAGSDEASGRGGMASTGSGALGGRGDGSGTGGAASGISGGTSDSGGVSAKEGGASTGGKSSKGGRGTGKAAGANVGVTSPLQDHHLCAGTVVSPSCIGTGGCETGSRIGVGVASRCKDSSINVSHVPQSPPGLGIRGAGGNVLGDVSGAPAVAPLKPRKLSFSSSRGRKNDINKRKRENGEIDLGGLC